jgi:putative membrane protein
MNRRNSISLLNRAAGLIGVTSISVLVTLAGCGQQSDRNNTATPTTSSPLAQNSPDSTVSPGSTGSPGTETTPGASATPSPLLSPNLSNVLDNDLVRKVAQDNLFEIQAGQLASQKATNSAVKQFAQRMVQDHTRATPRVQQIASARNITLPTDMGAQNRGLLDRLSGLSGAAFDRAYADAMVTSHSADVALLQNQAQRGQDQDLKAQAAQNLPALQEHLQMAQLLSQQLGG